MQKNREDGIVLFGGVKRVCTAMLKPFRSALCRLTLEPSTKLSLGGSHPSISILIIMQKTERMGLSCSAALNGSARQGFSLSVPPSAASRSNLLPSFRLVVLIPSRSILIIMQKKTERMGFEPTVEHNPTQPFQDCTLNRSDTSLYILLSFSFSCSICVQIRYFLVIFPEHLMLRI